MTFLLDTNVVSELRRTRSEPAVFAWTAAQGAATLFLSVVTIMEIELGILRIGRRDPVQAGRLRRWMTAQVLAPFAGRILPINIEVAQRCARLHVPDPRPERDAMIAATALIHGLTVVTRNTADFAATGVVLLNPWLPAAQ